MNTIIKIDHLTYLLPSEKDAMTVMQALAKAVRCDDHYSHLVLREESPDLEIKILNKTTKMRRATKDDPHGEQPENEVIVPPYRGAPKRLAAPRKLLRGGGQ